MNRVVREGSGAERVPVSEEDGDDVDGRLLVDSRRSADSFGLFYDRNVSIVLAFFYQRTASADSAAELTAETFSAALQGLHRYRPAKGSGRAWLFGIATNQYRQFLRRGRVEMAARSKLVVLTPVLETGDFGRIEALIDFAPLIACLNDALGLLSPALRAAVELRVRDDLPYREVAERLGCTENSARVRVSRGLDRLRQHLESVA